MYPDHYAVPEGLDVRLMGYVRWGSRDSGSQITTLWMDPSGNSYYCEDLWTFLSAPFWIGTRMSDLVQVTPAEFDDHITAILRGIEDSEWRASVQARFLELVYVWGYACALHDTFEKGVRSVE